MAGKCPEVHGIVEFHRGIPGWEEFRLHPPSQGAPNLIQPNLGTFQGWDTEHEETPRAVLQIPELKKKIREEIPGNVFPTFSQRFNFLQAAKS